GRGGLDLGESIRVDRCLDVLRSDDDECGIQQSLLAQLGYHLADSSIDVLDLTLHGGGRGPGRVCVATLGHATTVRGLEQFLYDYHSLEVHAEDIRHRSLVLAKVCSAVNLIQDGVDLKLVVALDVQETVGPRSGLGCIANGRARGSRGGGDSRQSNYGRI